MSDAQRYAVSSMTRFKVKVTSHSKLEIWPFSKAISSAIYNGSWQIGNWPRIRKLEHSI